MASDDESLARAVVVFVLGGPGSGKGTVCSALNKERGWAHYSAGDLLRAEAKSGSELGVQIADLINQGKIVPPELLMGLLKAAMLRSIETTQIFLIDGFPRSLAQADNFEKLVVKPKGVLLLTCTKDIMLQRCLKRGDDREDDNMKTLITRYEGFLNETGQVVDLYRAREDVPFIEVDGTQDVAEVYAQTTERLLALTK